MRSLRPGGWSAPLLACGVAMAGSLAGCYLFRRAAPPVPAHPFPEMPRMEAVDEREAIRRSMEARQAVARRVIEGGCPLLDAAVEMRRIDRRSPHFKWGVFRARHPDMTDDERHCREVAGWVEYVLAARPEEAAEWDRRMEDEIARRRADGTLTLPADDPP